MKGESGPKAAPEGPAAKPDARSHLSLVDGQPLQLDLFILAHRLHPAEADLRSFVNRVRRERSHWWIAAVRRHHREYPDCRCRHCMGWGWAA
jgi:hypothetical protein